MTPLPSKKEKSSNTPLFMRRFRKHSKNKSNADSDDSNSLTHAESPHQDPHTHALNTDPTTMTPPWQSPTSSPFSPEVDVESEEGGGGDFPGSNPPQQFGNNIKLPHNRIFLPSATRYEGRESLYTIRSDVHLPLTGASNRDSSTSSSSSSAFSSPPMSPTTLPSSPPSALPPLIPTRGGSAQASYPITIPVLSPISPVFAPSSVSPSSPNPSSSISIRSPPMPYDPFPDSDLPAQTYTPPPPPHSHHHHHQQQPLASSSSSGPYGGGLGLGLGFGGGSGGGGRVGVEVSPHQEELDYGGVESSPRSRPIPSKTLAPQDAGNSDSDEDEEYETSSPSTPYSPPSSHPSSNITSTITKPTRPNRRSLQTRSLFCEALCPL
ncbi:hypothetical protein HK102_009723, partial [Quaeritorhiza haematococci]